MTTKMTNERKKENTTTHALSSPKNLAPASSRRRVNKQRRFSLIFSTFSKFSNQPTPQIFSMFSPLVSSRLVSLALFKKYKTGTTTTTTNLPIVRAESSTSSSSSSSSSSYSSSSQKSGWSSSTIRCEKIRTLSMCSRLKQTTKIKEEVKT